MTRLTNGVVALVAPSMFLRRLGMTPEQNPAAIYVLRMFGIRTVLLGLDLIGGGVEQRQRALRHAPIIHLVDGAAAMAAGVSRQLPLRGAFLAASISALNLALAVAARRR